MNILTLTELLRLSRVELCDELSKLTNVYPDYPEGSDDSFTARHNLCQLLRALAQRQHEPP